MVTICSFLHRFWVIFASFLDRFWIVFGSFLNRFWIVFGSFLNRFWIVFGSFLHRFCIVFGLFLGSSFCIFFLPGSKFYKKSKCLESNNKLSINDTCTGRRDPASIPLSSTFLLHTRRRPLYTLS